MTDIRRRTFPANVRELGEREVEIAISTSALAADGDIWMTAGVDLARYRGNPVMLWSHSPETPVARAESIRIEGDELIANVMFAPAGVSAKADEICGLVKSRIISGISAGAIPIEMEPLDAKKPRGGQRWTRWELIEVSFVSIPANTEARVTARAAGDEAQPKEKPGMDGERALAELRKRLLVTAPKPKFRGLYDIAGLAYTLGELGYLHNSALWEAEIEQDESSVPAMLGEAMQQLGVALIAMTQEEVGELLAGHGIEVLDIELLPAAERAFVASAKSPLVRAWRAGIAAARSIRGKGDRALAEKAAGHHATAAERLDNCRGALGEVAGAHEAAADAHARALGAHDKATEALEAANGSASPEVAEQIGRAQKHMRAVGRALDAMGEAHDKMGDATGDADGHTAGCNRSIRAAQRCMRSLLDADGDTDSKDVQNSEGLGESGGSANDRSLDLDTRRRRALVLELADTP